MASDNGVPRGAGPSDAVRAALITAAATVVVTLGGIAINSCATNNAQESAQRAALKQQASAFRNQRAIANRLARRPEPPLWRASLFLCH